MVENGSVDIVDMFELYDRIVHLHTSALASGDSLKGPRYKSAKSIDYRS